MELFVWCFCLVLARVASFVTFLPLFGTLGMPKLVKVGLVFALTMVWYVPLAEEIQATLFFALFGFVIAAWPCRGHRP